MLENFMHQRPETKGISDEYHSVEIPLREIPYVYQFKIWNLSQRGRCVLVKEDCPLLNYLKVGDIVEVGYQKANMRMPAEFSKTKIRHITKDDNGRFKGHYLIGI